MTMAIHKFVKILTTTNPTAQTIALKPSIGDRCTVYMHTRSRSALYKCGGSTGPGEFPLSKNDLCIDLPLRNFFPIDTCNLTIRVSRSFIHVRIYIAAVKINNTTHPRRRAFSTHTHTHTHDDLLMNVGEIIGDNMPRSEFSLDRPPCVHWECIAKLLLVSVSRGGGGGLQLQRGI